MMCRVFLLGLLAVAVVAPSSDHTSWVGCTGHDATCTMLRDLYNACNGANWKAPAGPGPWERWGSSSENRAYCHWQGIRCNADRQLVRM